MPDRLANYVPVAERLSQAQGEIIAVESDAPVMLTDVMGYIRVAVYLSDGRKATGTASFRLDLQGKSAQATNPIEDCETSALGRALGMLGYSSNKSIASREEVREAQRRQNGASYELPDAELEKVSQLSAARRQRMLDRITTLTADAEQLDLEITLLKPLDQMTEAELIQHGKNLAAAVEHAAPNAVTKKGAVPLADVPDPPAAKAA